jgi:predicted nucleotide-binding protein
MSTNDRRRRLLKYLYENRHRPVERSDAQEALGSEYLAELDYLRDKGAIEFVYDNEMEPFLRDLIFQVRITAQGIDEVEEEERVREGEERTRTLRTARPSSNRIFIVHGHDAAPKEELARMLENLGLSPIILHEQPEKGRVIIEKLEQHTSDVDYGFILLTPDDVGSGRGAKPRDLKPRARQNVIFEFGYLMGKLGRNRICCLYTGEVEKPSDIDGVVYIRFRDSVHEAYEKIVKELRAAGYKPTTE